MSLYEKFKSTLVRVRCGGDEQLLSKTDYLCAAMSAKFIACAVTYPHEVVKTRLREQKGGGGGYRGIWDTITSVAKYEGVRGLYGGMGAHLMRTVPNAAILFMTYELMLRVLRDLDIE
eukprot:TRINITY_DN3974_c1_g1_i2.p1 TRINITY_DN3974_c1_g1~~TRINITY_DN3974_c1_g1_i2.p1  ORF type:complete len:118 (-),score=32.14 TRINITY_DN3974_c1_g1_i2:70-423(-)